MLKSTYLWVLQVNHWELKRVCPPSWRIQLIQRSFLNDGIHVAQLAEQLFSRQPRAWVAATSRLLKNKSTFNTRVRHINNFITNLLTKCNSGSCRYFFSNPLNNQFTITYFCVWIADENGHFSLRVNILVAIFAIIYTNNGTKVVPFTKYNVQKEHDIIFVMRW